MHIVLHERLLSVQDLQSAWLLLLFCANARATYLLCGIPPSEVAEFAEAHDEATWQCFMRLLSLPLDTPRRDFESFPFQLGGCGLLSALRSRVSPLGELGGQFARSIAVIQLWQT